MPRRTDLRGSSRDRRRRKCWLLAYFGDGISVQCYRCLTVLLYSTLTVDRIEPGMNGGRYVRANVRPACRSCNSSTGALAGHARRHRPTG